MRYAYRAVHKGFQFQRRRYPAADFRYFQQRKLARQYDAGRAERHPLHACRVVGDAGLRGDMHFQPRRMLPHQGERAEIAQNAGIDPRLRGGDKGRELRKVAVAHKAVAGKIYGFPVAFGIVNALCQSIQGKFSHAVRSEYDSPPV